MTSDAGGLLLREPDRRLNLLPRLAQCFLDGRAPARIRHSEKNTADDRRVTAALYGGDRELRIQQEIVLGIGGMRAAHLVPHERRPLGLSWAGTNPE